MKVLMLGWELPPHNSGGLGVACYELCRSLSNSGVDIEFVIPYTAEHDIKFMTITPAHPQGVQEVIKSGIAYDSYKYIYSDQSTEWVDIFTQSKVYEKSISKIVDSSEFDIIHAHDWLTFRAGIRAKQISGKPLVLHVHSIEHDRSGGRYGNPLVREIEQLAFLMADKIVAVSELTKRKISKYYNIPAHKIDVVHNSIDIYSKLPLDNSNTYKYLTLLKEKGYRVVVNIGRLTIQKNLPNLLYSAQKVISLNPKVIFLFVGNGELERQLLELSAELGISQNVIFTGFQRGKAWRDAYAIGDLFVMPSISEPFGLTPLEAIGYGTPALVSKQSGVSEVVNNCLKVDYWDVDEMANQIGAVVGNDALRDELHKNSLKEYSKLSWSKSTDKLISLYNRQLRSAVA